MKRLIYPGSVAESNSSKLKRCVIFRLNKNHGLSSKPGEMQNARLELWNENKTKSFTWFLFHSSDFKQAIVKKWAHRDQWDGSKSIFAIFTTWKCRPSPHCHQPGRTINLWVCVPARTRGMQTQLLFCASDSRVGVWKDFGGWTLKPAVC